jgi:hypothetical protein
VRSCSYGTVVWTDHCLSQINTASSTSPFARQVPTDSVLGIHHLGVHVFEKGSSRKLIKSFRIEDISRYVVCPTL